MKNNYFTKIRKLIIAMCVVVCVMTCCVVCAYAADDGEIRVTTPQNITGGTNATAVVSIDCGDRVFVSGSVKVRLPNSHFGNVSSQSDTDIKWNFSADAQYFIVEYSFNIAEGLHDTVQLGTISFTAINTLQEDVSANIEIFEIKLNDDKGNTDISKIAVVNPAVIIKPGVSASPTQTQALPSATVPAQSTAGGGAGAVETATAAPGAGKPTPQATNMSQILTDTDVYTLEDVEDLSAGAIVFWSIVFLVVGIWVGIGFGYMFWGKKKSKRQIKDSNSHVIGHLK